MNNYLLKFLINKMEVEEIKKELEILEELENLKDLEDIKDSEDIRRY